ncbi:MAG: DNA primase [Desulfuromonadales bacterium]|nr:DNA primase [Desulfuromonadales bacterium]
MTGQITESKINEVRERSDIVELISQYVSLKRAGGNHVGLCPFHSEKSPSFSVNAARQFFHCFGCGVGGDVYSFLMKIEGLTFPDAVRRLAERAGIDLEERSLSPEEERRQEQRERLYALNGTAAAYFHRLLMEHPAGAPARDYMRQRGYGRKAAEEYQIGYSLPAWEDLQQHLTAQGCSAEDARTLGLVRPGKQDRGDYDLFRGRLIFPVYDLTGRVVAFAGRVLDEGKPKYINSPESPIYHKGRVLFGLYQARQAMRRSGEVILVEGYFDQLALYRAGFPQVVATCGTALTADHARLLKRYVQRVLLLFDQDSAGTQATFKAMRVLQAEGVPAAVITLPQGEAPDSFLRSYGGEAFSGLLAEARPVMDVYMEDALSDCTSIEEKVRAAEQIIEQIDELNSELEQDLYLKELARRSGIELDLLKRKRKQRNGKKSASVPLPDEYPLMRESGPAGNTVAPDRPAPTAMSRAEETLLGLLSCHAAARERFIASGGPELLIHPVAVTLAQLLIEDRGLENSDPQSLGEGLDPEMRDCWKKVCAVDRGAFGDDVDVLFDDCLLALERHRKKQQREEILTRIRRFEQLGEMEKAKDLLEEFKKLK